MDLAKDQFEEPVWTAGSKELLNEVPTLSDRHSSEIYWLNHWDAHRIQLLIDEAAFWGRKNRVPLLCNEFGVYREAVDPVSRNAWIHVVRTALEADGIGWAMCSPTP